MATTSGPGSKEHTCAIVGIGASAGGLEALERLFTGMPAETGLAFVIVQHLSPDFRSMMDELLGRYTELPVVRVQGATALKPDHIYLMPPRSQLIVREGRLVQGEPKEPEGLFLPIDAFLRSLAEDAGERAIAVILSGTGSDGSRGARAIHERGGLVLVQSEASARFNGMPRSTIDTGVADLILPPAQLRDALVNLARHPFQPLPIALDPDALGDVGDRILRLLHRETGLDFQGYKPSTVGRRIDRRLLLTRTQDLESYLVRLQTDPDEVRALYRDLLIGVTDFFRDPDAFEVLRTEVLPELVGALQEGDELRIWSAACATGEEPYSLAILAAEAIRQAGVPARLKVLATDVHRASLDVASAGVYPASSLEDLPPDLRDRYFRVRGDAAQVSAELRGQVVFAQHNALRDAPFTRLDLISCRNLLIYLRPDAQERALALLHFGLRKGGALFLGPSESPGPLREVFEPVDRRWKVYRKLGNSSLPPDVRPSDALLAVRPRRSPGPLREVGLAEAQELLISRHAPPSLLVEEDLTLVHTFKGAGRFLVQRDGAPSYHLVDLVEGELRYAISGAARRCVKEGRPVTYGGVRVRGPDGEERVRVTCEPLVTHVRRMILVTLEPVRRVDEAEGEAPPADLDKLAQERIEALEMELRITRENLQATGEEMEASSEELQSANEELIASNEELQSTNEELQSVNEELYSVNAEYQSKIAELTELTNDMDHLLQATEVHVVFLDRDLRIRKFTPKVAETFHLIERDVGRRIDSFAHDLDHPDLLRDLQRVLQEGRGVEREVTDRAGRSYLLRVLPYCPHDRILGVVLTLIDISSLKRVESDLRHSEARYRTLVRAAASVLWCAEADGLIAEPQPEWELYTGQQFPEYRAGGWLEAVHPDDRAAVEAAWRQAVEARTPLQVEGRVWSREEGEWRHFLLRAAPVLDGRSRVREWVCNLVDVEETWRATWRLEERERQLQGILTSSPGLILVQDRDGRFVLVSASFRELLGVEESAIAGRRARQVVDRRLADALERRLRMVVRDQEVVRDEERVEAPEGERTYLAVSFPLLDSAGACMGMATVAEDITDRKRAEEVNRDALRQRDRFIAMMSHELRNPLGVILHGTHALQVADMPVERRVHVRKVIREQALHMSRLLDDLLDVARISRGTLELRREQVDLAELVRRVVEASRIGFERKGLALELWVEHAPLPVQGDADRLQQAVSNVLRNALKFTGRGSVKVHARRAEDRAVVEVRDSGIGMTSDDLARMYDTFYQRTNDLARSAGGLGIGLTLTRSLLALHGGTIEADSPGLGQGSTFTLTLPIAEGEVGPVEVLPAAPGEVSGSVALVEDNADGRAMMKMLLELHGIEVLEAADGPSGVRTILEGGAPLAFVDIGLPKMTGYEVAEAVRRHPEGRRVRLVALTGYGREEDRQRALASGFDEHLVKPMRPEDLERLLGASAAEE